MEAFTSFFGTLNSYVWGSDSVPYPPVLILLLVTGLYLTVRLGFMPIRRIPYAFTQLFRGGHQQEEGDVSPFGALMTALSSTIGTGNIAGVAAAIAIGGPGAVFWMWMTALLGMASKYAEGLLAVKYREVDHAGRHVGGPMYYIKNGMGPSWAWLGFVFAAFGILASWGTGASVQAFAVADALQENYAIQPWLAGAVMALAAGAVIIGGIRSIASVAEKLVPTMAIAYLVAGLIVVGLNIQAVPEAFMRIVTEAFGFKEAGTGITIGLLLVSMQKGVARGIFSNEAGQGSAPIAHAAAKNQDPVNQGIVAMLGTFIDTIIVCSITAFVILTAGLIPTECEPLVRDSITSLPEHCLNSSPLTAAAFNESLPNILDLSFIPGVDYVLSGNDIVAVGLAIFGFTTIIGWSYYGERCAEFLFGEWIIMPFKISWVVAVFGGAAALMLKGEGVVQDVVSLFWLVADTLTGLMAAPNLVALIVMSPLIAKMTKEYFARDDTPND